MTSCIVVLFLCVFLCSIDLSEEKINDDYFENVASWGEHLENQTVLIETNNIMEMILSGFNRFCEKTQEDENFLHSMACTITNLHDASDQRVSETGVRVPFFHLACLYAKLNKDIRDEDGKPPPVCGDFDVIFGLYQKVNEFIQSSTTTTTTLPTTTTTTTTLQTTTTTTTLPTTTTTLPTTLQTTTTTTLPTTTTTLPTTTTTVTPPTKMPNTTKTTTLTPTTINVTSTKPINDSTTLSSTSTTTVTPPTQMPDTTKTTTITMTSTELTGINGGAAMLFGHAHSQQTKRLLGFGTYNPQSNENLSYKILLLSLLLNLVLMAVVVYTCFSSNRKQQVDAHMLNGTTLTEYQPSTMLETEKECDRESKHLMQQTLAGGDVLCEDVAKDSSSTSSV